MLRINLLPPYIYEGAKRRNVIVLWTLVLLCVIGGFVYAKVQLDAQAKKIADDTAQLSPTADQADQTEKKAQDLIAKNAGTKAKVTFVHDGLDYNQKTYPPLFDNVRDFTITRVLYSSVVPGGQQVQISAYAPSLAEVGHYMMAMEKNPNISNLSIGINSIPGFPVQKQASTTQETGFPGGPPGMGYGAGPMGMGGPPMSSGGGTRGKMGQMMAGMMGGQMGSRGMGNFGPPGGFGGNQQTAAVTPPGGGGHEFTATLTLVKQIPAGPTYPAGGGGEAAGGMGGGMPGMMGGPPAGMMGGPPAGMMGSGAAMGGGAGKMGAM